MTSGGGKSAARADGPLRNKDHKDPLLMQMYQYTKEQLGRNEGNYMIPARHNPDDSITFLNLSAGVNHNLMGTKSGGEKNQE